MKIFYNLDGIGDTLIISIKTIDQASLESDRKGDITRIYNKDTNETTGFNLFNISEKMTVNGTGAIQYNENFINQLNTLLHNEGFGETLVYSNDPDFVVGFVKQKEKHPNADKLNICQVDIGGKQLQIVCGAPNVEAGQKVVVAKVGAVMPSGMTIKEASLRGVASSGMICSAKELDLPDAPQEKGILVLDKERTVGESFFNRENH